MIVMASNLPLADLDFYHRPKKSIDHIKSLIRFTAELPGTSGARATFHLNTLLSPKEWDAAGTNPKKKFAFFQKYFSRVLAPALAEVARYGKAKGVPLNIETTPVPEFGDRPDDIALNELGNPYPLYGGRGIKELRDLGFGIALDLCHTHTLYQAAALPESAYPDFYERYKGIFPNDRKWLRAHCLLDEVEALEKGDVLHLNDGRAIYKPRRGVIQEEGIALGKGEIKNLAAIVRHISRRQDLHVVFEINETDYQARPNLKKSIAYFQQATQTKKGTHHV